MVKEYKINNTIDQDREDFLLDLYKIHAYIPNDAADNPLTPFGNFCEGYKCAQLQRERQDNAQVESKPIAVYGTKRLIPGGTSEFWGFKLVDSILNKAKLYTASPQPQSVKDALEQAASMLEAQINMSDADGNEQILLNNFLFKRAGQIRALIQTEKGEL